MAGQWYEIMPREKKRSGVDCGCLIDGCTISLQKIFKIYKTAMIFLSYL
jgi:hypothetical protein